MNAQRTCPKCGVALPADAPEGLCPQRLMQAAVGSQSSTASSETTTVADQTKPGTAPTLAEIAKHFPQLEILELIGQGGMGIVYKARQPNLDRFVALKILAPEVGRDPAFAERFARQAQSPGFAQGLAAGNVR